MKRATPKLHREKLVAIVAKEAKRLERLDGGDAILHNDLLLVGLGWESNDRSHTTKHLASAVSALAALASNDALAHTAYLAIWRRYGSNAEAEVTSRRILEPLGVRYAACGCFDGNDSCCDRALSRPADHADQPVAVH